MIRFIDPRILIAPAIMAMGPGVSMAQAVCDRMSTATEKEACRQGYAAGLQAGSIGTEGISGRSVISFVASSSGGSSTGSEVNWTEFANSQPGSTDEYILPGGFGLEVVGTINGLLIDPSVDDPSFARNALIGALGDVTATTDFLSQIDRISLSAAATMGTDPTALRVQLDNGQAAVLEAFVDTQWTQDFLVGQDGQWVIDSLNTLQLPQ